MWEPHSYVSEVIGAARHRNAQLFTSTHETVFEKQQHSKMLAEALQEDHLKWNVQVFADEEDCCELRVYWEATCTVLPPDFVDALKQRVSAAWRAILSQSSDYCDFLCTTGADSPGFLPANKSVVQQCFLMSTLVQLCNDAHVMPVVMELPCATVVFPGVSWTAAIRGIPFHVVDKDFFVKTHMMCPSIVESPLFLVNATVGDASGDAVTENLYAISVLGSGLNVLLRTLVAFTAGVAGDVSKFIMHLSQDVQIDDFFCVCSDGTETCRDAAVELRELKMHGGGETWNVQAHAEKCVRVGNTADAMHLLEGNHTSHNNTRLTRSLVDLFVNAIPVAHVILTVGATNGDVVSQLSGSFQLLDRTEHCGCVSVPRSSPLFNYFSAPSAHDAAGISVVLLGTDDVASFRVSGTTQWCDASDTTAIYHKNRNFYVLRSLSPEVQHSALSFSVSHSHEIGDCVVFVGQLSPLTSEMEPPLVLLQGAHQITVPSCDTVVVPILCTMMHRLYGQIGVMASAMTMCSNFPTCILINVPQADSGSVLDEHAIDPNFTLYTFRNNTALFDGRAYSSVVTDLPFPMVQLTEPTNQESFQHTLHCRLIRVEPYGSRGHHICILSVSKIEGDLTPCKMLQYTVAV